MMPRHRGFEYESQFSCHLDYSEGVYRTKSFFSQGTGHKSTVSFNYYLKVASSVSVRQFR